MKIERVQNVSGGYKVNNQFFIPNDENNSDYQDVKKWIKSGGIVDPEFTSEQILEKSKSDRISTRLNYLQSTDWQAAAFIKYGRKIDDEIKEKCKLANDEINNIENIKSLEELEKFILNFE